MASLAITQVWSNNFAEELINLDVALARYPMVCIDCEFPGFSRDTPREASDIERYNDLRFNVNPTKPIQLGITLTDNNGSQFLTWEFNFHFSIDRDNYAYDSIQFLRHNGIDFEKLESHGINVFLFAKYFSRIVYKHRDLQWVTFHGLYDLAYALKLVTLKPLPYVMQDFTAMLGIMFGRVIDIKYMAKFCSGLHGGELGLQRMAQILRVNRVGGAHQAGSDTLLTARVFMMMKKVYDVEESRYEGFLYSITPKIHKLVAVLPFATPRRYCHPYPQFNGLIYSAAFSQHMFLDPC